MVGFCHGGDLPESHDDDNLVSARQMQGCCRWGFDDQDVDVDDKACGQGLATLGRCGLGKTCVPIQGESLRDDWRHQSSGAIFVINRPP